MASPATSEAGAQPLWPMVHHGGQMVPHDQAVLPVGSIALRYGISVFEGIRVYTRVSGGLSPWLLDQHVDRLCTSCLIMGLDERCGDGIARIIDELIQVNGVDHDSYVRVAASAGNAGAIDEVAQTVLTVSIAPSGRKRWLETGAGMRLAVGPWQRPSAQVFPSAAKNISAYAGPRLALTEAKRTGYDSCMLLTAEGLVSEAPTATVFLVENGRLVTPRLADCVLPGVTRAWVLAAARSLGLDTAEEAITPERLSAADEVFLCGTGLEFGPVREVEGVAIAGWPGCPITTLLVDEYFKQVRGAAAALPVDWASAGVVAG